MASEASTEKHSLLLKIERQVFAHQEEFDENFQKSPSTNKQNCKFSIQSLYYFCH